MAYYLKLVNVALLATVKFFYTPIYAFAIGLDFWSSFIGLVSGGIISFLAFYFATNIFLIYVEHLKPVIIKVTPNNTRLRYNNWQKVRTLKKKNKKIFTKRNRLLVRMRRKWGLWGIMLTSPFLLSIPIGSFLLRRYYGHRKIVIPCMFVIIIVEGFIINSIYWILFKGII